MILFFSIGNRGLLKEFWEPCTYNGLDLTKFSTEDNHTEFLVDDAFDIEEDTDSNHHCTRLTGYLSVAHSSKVKFELKCDDKGKFYIDDSTVRHLFVLWGIRADTPMLLKHQTKLDLHQLKGH